MKEAENLVKAGVKELLVISQDTSAYGVDVKYRTGFWNGRPLKTRMTELARALAGLGAWVRLHYVYPYPHVDEVVPLMAEGMTERGLLPYLDVPFQHASRRILKLMKRPASVENNLARIRGWREICPDITLRSTFIVGFPGETESEFEELLGFLEEAQLDRVGCFAYSAVEGATANALPDPVPEPLKQERRARFRQLQEKSAGSDSPARSGKRSPCWWTRPAPAARSRAPAPTPPRSTAWCTSSRPPGSNPATSPGCASRAPASTTSGQNPPECIVVIRES